MLPMLGAGLAAQYGPALLGQLLGAGAQPPAFAAYRGANIGGAGASPYIGGQLGGQLDASQWVGGPFTDDPYLDVGGPLAALRERIATNTGLRQAGRQAQSAARINERFNMPSPAAAAILNAAPSVDEGQVFESANLGGLWRRTGIILECPLNTSQQSVTAAATLIMSVEPEREVEILGFELSVEGSATNVEFQETQRASFGITTMAVGQDSMRAASGEGAGTLLSADKAQFRGFVAKSGRNINLTLVNRGVTAPVNVSAITQLVTPVAR